MNREEQQFVKMTQTPVKRLIISLGIPTIISMLVTAIYNLADTFFVSNIGIGDERTYASGAVGVGVNKLKLKERPKTIKEKQAAAAVGQSELMHIYGKFFGEYSHIVGQVLLTRDVVEDEHIRENVVNTFETLIENKVIPIVNENDTVAIDEIENIVRFGDNDNLSAIVAGLVSADLLIILSDIDGFYDSDPRKNPDSKMIKEVIEITKELEECAGGAGTSFGTGGMATKLTAAKTATRAGVDMVLANGDNPKILFDIVNGEEIGTLFIKN